MNADVRVRAYSDRRSMRLQGKWSGLIFLVLLALAFGGLTWISAVVTLEDWRSYRAEGREKVLVERVRTAQQRVSQEVTTRIYIDLELQVRRRNGEQLMLYATFIGATPDHLADIDYLVSNKGREIELWIDQRRTGRFTLRHEFSFYRFTMLSISGLMTLFFTWMLFRVLKT